MHGNLNEALERIFAILFIAISSSAMISMFSKGVPQLSSGFAGMYIHRFFEYVSGAAGAYFFISIMNIIGLILIGLISVTAFLEFAGKNRNLTIRLKDLIAKFKYQVYEKNLPFITVDNGVDLKNGKLPWITKKKINLNDASSESPLKFIELKTSITSDIKGFNSDITRQFNSSALAESKTEKPVEIFSGFNEIKTPSIDINEPIEVLPDEFFYADSDNFKINSETNYAPSDTINIEQETLEQEKIIDTVPVEEINKTEVIKVNDIEEEIIQEDDEILSIEKDSDDEDAVLNTDSTVERVFDDIAINKEYIIPTGFLNSTVPSDSESWKSEIRKNSVLLVNTLNEFGIESKVINVNRGPVITLYELQIAPGIKVNRVVSLSDDIAMALAAYKVRIIAPIPGKSAIGVEIPNLEREDVTVGDIIKSEEYQAKTGLLKVALGKDILGKPITLDLKKQPHLLIAGATGSGKSVCVNSIITSLIYNYNPNYLRFIMVDPKMVELQLYNGLPHLLTPVITEPQLAPGVLKWSTYEMDRRYRLLAELNTRDIEKYNEKVSVKGSKRERLPYIIILIDELADLMMVSSKEIEGYITRIAQKSRAVGIHLVLATQRPSVDVITGIIKANFPARIAFQVAQKTDSRTIIDQNGAEKLLGRGDMLYQSPFSSYPVRIQGAFISEDEVMEIATHLKKNFKPNYIDIEQSIREVEEEFVLEDNGDELFVEALKIIEETRKASASYLQRRLSIGYNRAAKLIELMEDRGYIGPQHGSKPREVFI